MSRISVIDEIEVAGDAALDVQRRYLDEYAPTAIERGMTLEAKLLSPPVLVKDGTNRLTFIWTVPDLPSWWKMRFGGTAPHIQAFWAALKPMIVARTRRVHMEGVHDA